MSRVAVIAVKQLDNAKQRLAGLLTAAERKGLFTAMVEDVLAAVNATQGLSQTLVVTSDAHVAALGQAHGAEILPEPEPPGLIEAVTAAGKALAARGAEAMLFLPGDTPLATPEELEVVLAGLGAGPGPEFLIVPAADLGGSNCVVCSPPDCMTFGFGEDSFRRHLRLARQLGMTPQVVNLPGIGHDVDTPADLLALIDLAERQGRDCRTMRYLAESGSLQKVKGQKGQTVKGSADDQASRAAAERSARAKA